MKWWGMKFLRTTDCRSGELELCSLAMGEVVYAGITMLFSISVLCSGR